MPFLVYSNSERSAMLLSQTQGFFGLRLVSFCAAIVPCETPSAAGPWGTCRDKTKS